MTGIELIAAERQRQIEVEGWTSQHDDAHSAGDLALAGAQYAMASVRWMWTDFHMLPSCDKLSDAEVIRRAKPVLCKGTGLPNSEAYGWPFSLEWWKPKGAIEDLTRAGALIAAEIDRIQRDTRSEPEAKEPKA